jgi:hypothetical protein
MPIDAATSRFADTVRAFCQWAEGEPASQEAEAETARLYVARLYAQVLELSATASWDGNAPEISHKVWRTMFDRFNSLPVGSYASCFDPLDVSAREVNLGDLGDDLADIWRDLRSGLDLFDAGEVEGAVFEWQLNFRIHWGRHAASALHVLQCWIAQNDHFGANDDSTGQDLRIKTNPSFLRPALTK